jgi:hypothetical protein
VLLECISSTIESIRANRLSHYQSSFLSTVGRWTRNDVCLACNCRTYRRNEPSVICVYAVCYGVYAVCYGVI